MILLDDDLNALLNLFQNSMKITGEIAFSDAHGTHDFDDSLLSVNIQTPQAGFV